MKIYIVRDAFAGIKLNMKIRYSKWNYILRRLFNEIRMADLIRSTNRFSQAYISNTTSPKRRQKNIKFHWIVAWTLLGAMKCNIIQLGGDFINTAQWSIDFNRNTVTNTCPNQFEWNNKYWQIGWCAIVIAHACSMSPVKGTKWTENSWFLCISKCTCTCLFVWVWISGSFKTCWASLSLSLSVFDKAVYSTFNAIIVICESKSHLNFKIVSCAFDEMEHGAKAMLIRLCTFA